VPPLRPPFHPPLSPPSPTPTPQVASDSKLVMLTWRCCHDLAQRVGKTFDSLRPMALLLLLQLLTAAATAAVDMQKAAAVAGAAAAARAAAAVVAAHAAAASDNEDSDNSSSSSDGSHRGGYTAPHHRRSGSSSSYGVTSGPRSALGDISAASDSSEDELHRELHVHSQTSLSTSQWASGTWGDQLPGGDSEAPGLGNLTSLRRRRRGSKRGLLAAPVSDEAIQAQAWLPHLLHDLLHYASSTAKQVSV
jgi:hypothetical protein